VRVWIGLGWPRIGSCSEILLTWHWILEFHKRPEISCLDERLLPPQKVVLDRDIIYIWERVRRHVGGDWSKFLWFQVAGIRNLVDITARTSRISSFWDISPCSWKSTDVSGNMSPSSWGSQNNRSKKPTRWLLIWLTLRPWIWRWHVPPKRRLTFNGLHGVISQQI
jgi:hypothetical protein